MLFKLVLTQYSKQGVDMRYLRRCFQILLFALFSQTALANGDADSEFYRAADGKVDSATFVGWSMFHKACVNCHASAQWVVKPHRI